MMRATGWGSAETPQEAIIKLTAENDTLKKDLEKAKNKVKSYKARIVCFLC